MSSIEENNKMRVRQLGEKPSSEMTMREKMATEILNGLASGGLTSINEATEDIVNYAITLTDSLISRLNR